MASVPIQPVKPRNVGQRRWLRRPSLGRTALARHEARWGLIFLSPWLVGFAAFTFFPLIWHAREGPRNPVHISSRVSWHSKK